jgi:signal peptidase II
MTRTGSWLALAGLIVAVDQLTKYCVSRTLALGQSVILTPFFNLVLVHNPGAAFSFLSDQSGWQRGFFIAMALAASVWIVCLLARHARARLFALALALVLAGAMGNVIDRILIGAVVDFLDFHAFGFHWPAFNVADSSITCGAVLLAWDALRPKQKDEGGRMKEGGV